MAEIEAHSQERRESAMPPTPAMASLLEPPDSPVPERACVGARGPGAGVSRVPDGSCGRDGI